MHSLRIKKALDPLNTELLKPGAGEPPAADKTWKNPWAEKGTEFDPTRQASVFDRKLHLVRTARALLKKTAGHPTRIHIIRQASASKVAFRDLMHTIAQLRLRRSEIHTAAATGDVSTLPSFEEARENALKALDTLYVVAPDGDTRSCAAMTAEDIRYWKTLGETPKESVPAAKAADLKMHGEPKMLPPRHDVRSLKSEETKKELKEGIEGTPAPKPKTLAPAPLAPGKRSSLRRKGTHGK